MPTYAVHTPQREYPVIVEPDALRHLPDCLPPKTTILFVLTERAIWDLYEDRVRSAIGRPFEVLFYPGGEARKRIKTVEALAEEMVEKGADRSSALIAFGGGIVGDVGGYLAAGFMRGIPVIQAPTTLLAQVDAAVGGKTGVNLRNGKNLFGAFHQPLAVLIDPGTVNTLPEREYRAGLFEVIKHGVIRSTDLFELMAAGRDRVLAREPAAVERMIAESVRIKAEVVSQDERESDLRRILNFGHTFGHALEAETGYVKFLHGEAVGFGMKAAAYLGSLLGLLAERDLARILKTVEDYGPIPALNGIDPKRLIERMRGDKKTLAGKVHFVVPEAIGSVRIVASPEPNLVRISLERAIG